MQTPIDCVNYRYFFLSGLLVYLIYLLQELHQSLLEFLNLFYQPLHAVKVRSEINLLALFLYLLLNSLNLLLKFSFLFISPPGRRSIFLCS